MDQQEESENAVETKKGIFTDSCFFHFSTLLFADLQNRIQELELDKKKIQDEFNIQRAKLKDLFLQKEG